MKGNLICSRKTLDETLHILQEGVKVNCETVALWLGVAENDAHRVSEVYRPQQVWAAIQTPSKSAIYRPSKPAV